MRALFTIFISLLLQCACNTVTPAEQQAIAFDAIRIGVCQEKGRECKRVDGGDCWNVYDACISDAGLRSDR